MMEQLIDRLYGEGASLVVLHEGQVGEYHQDSTQELKRLANESPETLLHAKIAIRQLDYVEAQICIDNGVAEVFADHISPKARQMLLDAGIRTKTGKETDKVNAVYNGYFI